MPLLTDIGAIRAILNRDPIWSVYMLGDLAPGMFEHCTWHVTQDQQHMVALFRGYGFPILFSEHGVASLLDEFDEPNLFLHIQTEDIAMVGTRYRVDKLKPMWRLALDFKKWSPAPIEGARRLEPQDLEPLEQLYADGEETGDAPDFFYPEMLAAGVFYGLWQGNELIGAAGTHLISEKEGIACVGNVYTRRDRRNLGIARRLTSAVTFRLLGMGIGTIAMNVVQTKPHARRLYEKLGYRLHCEFVEGPAVRR